MKENLEAMQKLLVQLRKVEIDISINAKIGSEITLSEVVQLIKDTEDLTAKVIVIEKRLIETESMVNQLIDKTPSAIIIINTEGNIVRWNTSATTLLGWTLEEVLGRPLTEKVVPERYRFGLINQESLWYRNVLLPAMHKDGREINVVVCIVPIQMTGQRQLVGFVRSANAPIYDVVIEDAIK